MLVFVPFFIHFSCTVYSFSAYLTVDPAGESISKILLRLPIYLGAVYFQWFEFLQFIEQLESGFLTYFLQLQNAFETTSFFMNMCLMIKYDFFYEQWYSIETQQVIASFATGLMWFRLYTWMRIYEPTAFFKRLLFMTLKDVRSFSLMLILLIFAGRSRGG